MRAACVFCWRFCAFVPAFLFAFMCFRARVPVVCVVCVRACVRARARARVCVCVCVLTCEDNYYFHISLLTGDCIHIKDCTNLFLAGERLPFEPRCALHIRKQILVDNSYGCQTTEPVEMTYCMGSCGRSYFIPTMLTTDDTDMQVHCT